jgi:hypothetical protein
MIADSAAMGDQDDSQEAFLDFLLKAKRSTYASQGDELG